MSADRYEISECELDVLAITGPEGTRYIDGEDIEAKIIRQQARDIAELETDVSGLRSSEAAFKNDCEQLRTDLAAAVARAEQAEARLAAIDAAPTVAVVLESNRDFCKPHRYLNHSYEKMPPIGTELIARPAKD